MGRSCFTLSLNPVVPTRAAAQKAGLEVPMSRFLRTAGAILLLSLTFCTPSLPPVAAPARPYPTTPAVIPLAPATAEEISVEQLALVFPRRPIVVGFDVDDTLIFSTPAFNTLESEYPPEVIRPRDYAALTAEQKRQYHEFWNRLNEEADDRSIPKEIGRRLLAMHVARGDTIWVISKRQATVPPTDTVTRRYERMLGIKLANPVVQTNLADKTRFMAERGIQYYYGDADSDVAAAVAAGAVPIRVRRAADSYAKDVTHNGQLGEIVIRGSDR
jgi:acid phosphatase (class B)